MNVFITGDTHGDFSRFRNFADMTGDKIVNGKDRDLCIILGDAGLNYFGDDRDTQRKYNASWMPYSFLCIHGNHEMRPENIVTYELKDWHGGKVYVDPEYPSLLFARDGEVYSINGKRVFVIGGAYSVDKEYRLQNGYAWFPDEQPSDAIKKRVESKLDELDWKVDVVLSHTCPRRYEPVDAFLKSIDQSKVDKSTEDWLDTIDIRLTYEKWYCGHFHIERDLGKIKFLFKSISLFSGGKEWEENV